MRGYGQFCPVAKAAEVFCERWTPLILRDLAGGASRFSELQRGVPLASPTLLSRRLKALEADGIVERRRSPGGSAWTYHLTPAGREFAPIVEALGVWGQRWARRDLAEGEVDLGLLVWALERYARPAALGAGPAVVRLELVDQPAAKRVWWFLNAEGRCQLCVDDPGFEVALWLEAGLRDMIRVWRGDLTVAAALDRGVLVADGAPAALRALSDWLGLNPLAHVGPAEADGQAGRAPIP
ncbi:MAG: helix-turn-helix domain-containing protein [Azospirillaceae bacterium]